MDTVSVEENLRGDGVLIEVYPDEGRRIPSLPMLHKGDFYENTEGTRYEVLSACQSQQWSRDDDGEKVFWYSWVYVAQEVD